MFVTDEARTVECLRLSVIVFQAQNLYIVDLNSTLLSNKYSEKMIFVGNITMLHAIFLMFYKIIVFNFLIAINQ